MLKLTVKMEDELLKLEPNKLAKVAGPTRAALLKRRLVGYAGDWALAERGYVRLTILGNRERRRIQAERSA